MPSLHCFRKLKAGAAAVRHQFESHARVKGFVDRRSSLFAWNAKGSTPCTCPSTSAASFAASSPFCVTASSVPAKPTPEASWVGKTALSISEAVARVFATPSAHGTGWPMCGYQAPQVLKHEFSDHSSGLKAHGDLRCDATRDSGNFASRGKGPARVFVNNATLGSEVWRNSLLERDEVGSEFDCRLETKVLFNDGLTACRVSANILGNGYSTARNRLQVRACKEEDLANGTHPNKKQNEFGLDRVLGDGLGVGATGAFQHLLRSSAGYHLFRIGPGLPVVDSAFVRALHDASSGAQLASPGMVLDRSHDESCENQTSPNEQTTVDGNSLRLFSGACCLPHPEKVKTGGEDAYFICSDEPVVGVADGVGGWADVGVDAGEYARELMRQATIAVRQEPHGYVDPARVLATAHSKTKCRGSSTACILALSNEGLQAANLGDSGFVVVRNGRTIFKSPPQQHQFNIPFQLESGGSDPPSAAEVFSVPVAAGDVIVAGTDGVFDNLYDTELTSVVMQSTRGGAEPRVTAQRIAALASNRAQDRNRQTPFSAAAQDAGVRFYGGKMDDITVVVSYVSSKKSTDQRGKGFLFF